MTDQKRALSRHQPGALAAESDNMRVSSAM